MSELGIGVIGLGFMGSTHARVWNAAREAGLPCRLIAVRDVNPERLSGAASEGNIDTGAAPVYDPTEVHVYHIPDELLSDEDVDAVSICTPTDSHVGIAIRALDAGRHVLVEKPVAVQTDQVARLADAARAHPDLVCMPAMCMRFWPAWVWLADRVRDGSLGAVRSASFQRLGSRPGWSDFYSDTSRSGGALTDLHIHDTDFVVHLFGPPRSVSSLGDEHHLTTHYRFDAGPGHVAAEGGWDHTAGFAFRMRYVVVFEHATADFDLTRDPQLLVCRDGDAEPVDVGPRSGYDGEVRAFLDACRGGATAIPTIDDALTVARVLDAERESCARGVPVDVARD